MTITPCRRSSSSRCRRWSPTAPLVASGPSAPIPQQESTTTSQRLLPKSMAGPRGYVRLGSNLRHHGEEQEYCEDYQVNDALKHGSSAGAQRDHAGEQRQCKQDLVLRPQPELERLADHD